LDATPTPSNTGSAMMLAKVQWDIESGAELQRDGSREEKRHEREQHVDDSPQCHPQQHSDGQDGSYCSLDERPDDGFAGFNIRRLIKDGILPAEQVVQERRTKSEPQTSSTNGWLRRLREQFARVASMSEIKFQCFQRLEEGGHNERLVAIPRSARSAALFDRQTRPSSRKRGEGRPALAHVIDCPGDVGVP
jgi:hypothetical protein